MKAKKTSLSLNAKELEVIARALNYYSLQQMKKSETWAKGTGEKDGYHVRADIATDVQVRIYNKQQRDPELRVNLF